MHQGRKLRYLCQTSDIENRDIAEQMGITPTWLSALFHKELLPNKSLFAACRVFSKEPAYFDDPLPEESLEKRIEKLESKVSRLSETLSVIQEMTREQDELYRRALELVRRNSMHRSD